MESDDAISIDKPAQTRTKVISQDLHAEICRLAELVDLGTFLSDNSQEDDYVVVVEEAVHRLRRLAAEPMSAEMAAQARSNTMSRQDQKILEKSKQFEDDLLKSLEQVDKRDEWYAKYKRLSAKLQKEKAQQGVLEEFVQSQNKKIAVLVDHVDKLMKAIKLENTKRMKLVEETRKMQKEESDLRAKLDRQARMIASQQRAVREVSEGSKVLEDQLRLMDEKYLELRTKLDITRELLGRKVKAAKKESAELRTKYAFANHGAALDKVRVDEGWTWPPATAQMGGAGGDPASDRPASPSALESAFRDADGLRGARAHRSRSVDFSPAPLAVQTPQPSFPQSTAGMGTGTGTGAMSPKHRSLSPNSNADSRGRPASANSPPRAQAAPAAVPAVLVASQRPKSALYASAPVSGLQARRSLEDRALTHVVRKIERKQHGPHKRGGWTADRLIELLGT